MAEVIPVDAVLRRTCRLLLLAYPPDYRRWRGDEILGTLLDTTSPGRRVPRAADAVDVIAGGIRRRLRTAMVAGLDGGLAIAAPVALALAAGISAFALWRVEPISATGGTAGGSALFGHFRTLGPIAYVIWIVAAASRALAKPVASRILSAVAVGVTVALPMLSVAVSVDRPPLWVLMALTIFGLLAVAGTAPSSRIAKSSVDERVGVPAGAMAIAATASLVVTAWPPAARGFDYYYQPTMARVGTVVAVAVACVAVIAARRLTRGLIAQDWLWATVLLGLPAGWLGPFDSARLRLAAEAQVPHFGRLAQVLLATCVAMIAMGKLAQHRAAAAPSTTPPSAGLPARPGRHLASLPVAGGLAVGCALGLGTFATVGGFGYLGFVGVPLRVGLPGYGIAALVVLLVVGVAALASGDLAGQSRAASRAASRVAGGVAGGAAGRAIAVGGWAAVGSVVAAYVVAAYDNGWTVTAWNDFGHTVGLVSTLVFVPLSVCAAAAASVVAQRDRRQRRAAAVVVLASTGWLGYVTLPFILSWGPVLLVLVAMAVVLAMSK